MALRAQIDKSDDSKTSAANNSPTEQQTTNLKGR